MFRTRTRFVLTTCATKYLVNFGGVLQVDRFAPSGVRRAAETSAISISPTWAERRLHRGVRNSTGSSSSSSSSTCKVVFCNTMGTTGGGDSKVCMRMENGNMLLFNRGRPRVFLLLQEAHKERLSPCTCNTRSDGDSAGTPGFEATWYVNGV